MDKIKDKLSKLLRLAAANPNEHEAAAAYARAVELASRHGIGLDDLETAGDGDDEGPRVVEGVEQRLIVQWKRACAWRSELISGIAAAQRCGTYTSSRRGLSGCYCYGQPTDLDAVTYLYAAIAPEIDRRGRDYVAADPRRGRREGRAFRMGMANEIGRRLRDGAKHQLAEARTEAYARSGETGLARVNEIAAHVAAVETAVAQYRREHLRLRTVRRAAPAAGAYAAGRAAGRGMGLGGGKALGA